MSIAVTKMPMPAKSSPSRSSELRKSLVRIKADTDEAVLLFPDADATLAKLRNRASGAVAAVRESEGCFFVTRTTKAVDPAKVREGEPTPEAETCVGIWKTSTDPKGDASASPEGEAKTKTAEQEKAAPKAEAKAAPAKAAAKPDAKAAKGGVADTLS